MVPVSDQPLLLKWNDPIQRSLVRGRGRSIHKTINQQNKTIIHRLRIDSSLSYWRGCLNAFYWRKIFALDSVVVNTQPCLAHIEAS